MSQQTDKIKTLSNANEEETEIDLLELFYYSLNEKLSAKSKGFLIH